MTVRTTIFIEEMLLKQVKQYALDHKVTMAEVIRRGIALVLATEIASKLKESAEPSQTKTTPLVKAIGNKDSIPF